MAMENFVPRDLGEVKRLPDGRVKRIVAVCEGKKVLIDVINGQPKRQTTPEIPYFIIPPDRFHLFYQQIRAIISDGKKIAEFFKNVKKQDWAGNLEKCGITIGPDGKVIIPRWQTNKKTKQRKRVFMSAKDIDSAIRMQSHVMEYYDSGLSNELNRLLKKLAIIQPQLELRREVLLYAKTQMQMTIDEAYTRYLKIAEIATEAEEPNFKVLTDKTAQLAFLLINQWTCPYLHDIKLAIEHLNRAKKAASRKKLDSTLSHLLSAKQLLKALASDKRMASDKISKIDPIKTLCQIYRLDKTDEVLTLAKKKFPGRQVFPLTEMLVISRQVIEKQEFGLRPKTTSTPASRTPAEPKNKIPVTEQCALDFGA